MLYYHLHTKLSVMVGIVMSLAYAYHARALTPPLRAMKKYPHPMVPVGYHPVIKHGNGKWTVYIHL